MKCPHCGYRHGFDWDESGDYTETIGEFGDFFHLPVGMTILFDRFGSILYACPKCRVAFIGEMTFTAKP